MFESVFWLSSIVFCSSAGGVGVGVLPFASSPFVTYDVVTLKFAPETLLVGRAADAGDPSADATAEAVGVLLRTEPFLLSAD